MVEYYETGDLQMEQNFEMGEPVGEPVLYEDKSRKRPSLGQNLKRMFGG